MPHPCIFILLLSCFIPQRRVASGTDGGGDGEEVVSHTGVCSYMQVAVCAEQGLAHGTARVAGEAVC